MAHAPGQICGGRHQGLLVSGTLWSCPSHAEQACGEEICASGRPLQEHCRAGRRDLSCGYSVNSYKGVSKWHSWGRNLKISGIALPGQLSDCGSCFTIWDACTVLTIGCAPAAVPQHLCAGAGAGHSEPLHRLDHQRLLVAAGPDHRGARVLAAAPAAHHAGPVRAHAPALQACSAVDLLTLWVSAGSWLCHAVPATALGPFLATACRLLEAAV